MFIKLTDTDDDCVVVNREKIVLFSKYVDNPEHSVVYFDNEELVVKQTVEEIFTLLS